MGTITKKKIMFFMCVLKSLIVQSLSKPFLEPKTTIKSTKIISSTSKKKLKEKKEKNVEKSYFSTLERKIRSLYCKNFTKKIKSPVIKNITPDKLKYRLNYINRRSRLKIFKYNTMVHASVERYLRMEKYISKIISLSDFYFPMFEKKLKKYRLPIELKYLSIVESNLNPIITSKSGAKGIWQIMHYTGNISNLNIIRNLYDERNDPVKSTDAACNYLRYLYKKIRNWEFVIAAYNAGPYTVNKILKNKDKIKKSFWNLLDFFPMETQNYIPRFIAMNYIMNYYKYHNILKFLHNPYKYKYKRTLSVPIKEKISVKFFSYSLNIIYRDLKFLNSQFIIDFIKPYKKNFFLRFSRNNIYLVKYKKVYKKVFRKH
ncbi:lytic transglycosylase domain-containing protein [Blattabacterium cuenoti]|uniref:lytic transglycosylase domain-containing protein n=1 Tax=Blattabacterium cuenoti TaxID=1653831 RepID=UPI00163BE9B2|nr:lytic transglycosylase domain-containing protein [Blattabacterium cuenoti]